MIKKLTKFGRSTLSVILCLTMLLTTFCFFDIGSVISNAMVTVTENNKMKGSLSSQFMYAPEIAYLKPGSSAVQYFSNYDPATGKAISTNDATSRLEFDYKGATEIAIGVNRVYYKNGENDVDFSGTLKINNVTVTQNKVAYNATTSTSFSSIASSASGAISVTLNASQCSLTGAATGTTYYIQWVFRYKVDGAYHFAFMYTGVYVPLLDQAGTSTSQRYIASGSNPTENHSWSFITGAMKYSGGNRKSQFLGTTANKLMAAPLVSFVGRAQNENNYTIPCGDGQALNENNFSSSQTPYNTFVYNRPTRGQNELYYDTTSISVPSSYSGNVAGNVSITNTSDGVIGSGITLGMAYIVVDTSRYSNYNQIPYLSAGYAQFYHDQDGNGNKLNSIKSVKRYNKGSSTSIAYDGTIYCDVDTSNYKDHDSYSVARGLYKFNGSIIEGLVTFDTWFFNGYKHFVGYTESIGVHHYNGLFTETVNKQTLRTVYNDASHSHIDYKTYSSGYSAYYTELKSVAETLCNPQLYSKTTTSLSGTASGSVKAIETSIVNSTTTADNYVYFYVPEVIYLTPGKTTFQYYSDMSSVSLSNGVCTPTVNSANKDATGNIYFYYKNASKVKITQSGASSVSLSGGNVTSFNSYVNTSQSAVTTANISGGSVSSAASTYITWTATYVEDNIEKTVTAKSYVYSPYTSAFSAAARYKCSDGTNHFCDSFAYLSGVHSITGMNDVNRYASATNLTPLLGRLKEPVNNTHMTPDGTWVDGSSTSNAYASRFSDDSGGSDRVVVSHAGTGKIYVDTSRFTDLKMIPNLTFGFGVTDREKADELYYFVADYTGISTRGNGSTTSYFDEWNRTPNYVMWGNKNTKQTVSEGMKYNNLVVPGTNTLSTTDGTENKVIGTQVYTYQSGDRALNALYLHLDVVRANRSGLRKAVEYATKYSYALQAEYFNGSTQWTNYTTALANAQNALTKVDGTANFGTYNVDSTKRSGLAKTLMDAVDVLLNANRGTAPRNTSNYTATQKNVGLVANSNGTFTVAAIAEAASDGTASISKTFKAYDKVEFSAEQYEGYKYVGYIKDGASSNGDAFSATDYNNMVNSTDPVSKSKNETLVFGNAKNVDYSYTFYYILNPDVLFDNEFDFDQWALKATFSGAHSFDMATNTATITNPGTSTDYSTSNINGTGSYYMNVLPNHTYRISMKVKMGSTAGTVDYMAFAFRDANRTNPTVGTSPYYSRPSISLAANAEGTLTSEFKIPSDASYMTLRLGLRTASITASFSDIYIQDITTPGGFKDDVTDATPHANLSLISGSQIGNVASISRMGYAFDGWYNNQDSTGNGTGTKYTSTSTVGNSNLRLYAKWTVAPELMFDNEFRFDNITASDIASGANNSTYDIDYGSNKLRLNAKGSDAYTGQWYGIKSGAFAVTPGHTYRIRTTVKNTSSSAKYATVYIFCFADSNLNSTDTNGNRKSAGVTVASGAESTIDFNYTVQTGRYYGALRFGINDSANGDTAEFSNIYVQDTTSPGGVADDVTPADPINKVKLPGETVGSLADIERSGYTFTGWNTAKNGTGTTYTESTKMPSSNTQLWSQWDVNSYTITFAPNGGSVTPTSKTFTINDSISLPTPTRTGYTFSGWKVTEKADVSNWTLNDVYTGTSIPAGKYGNVTLTAQWTVNTYTITYKYNNGAADTTAKYTIEQSITLPSPSKTGYTFAGWKVTTAGGNWKTTDSVYKGTVAAGKYGNVTLTAQWTVNTYTITYKYNNGAADTTAKYTIEQSITLPSPSKTGYTFAGWKVTTAGGNWKTTDSVYKGTVAAGKYGNVTLTAQWTVNTYTITYKYNNGAADTTAKYTIEQSITLPSPSKTGYTFAGWKVTTAGGNWKTTDSVYKGTVAAGKYGNVTLTAQWTVNTYTITYKYNNGAADTTAKYTIEQSITLPSPSKTGYTFAGWKVTTAGGNWKTTDSVYKGTVAAGKYGNVTLTAQWTVNTYTITYKYNNGAADTTAKYTIEQSITLPSPSKTGYTFAGWKVTTAGGNWKTTDSVYKGTVAAGKYGNVTLTAQWTANVYTITFLPNGGSVNPTSKTFTIESTIDLPTPTKDSYIFDGWLVTTAEGNWTNGTLYTDSSIPAGKYGNVTVTAQWHKTVTVHFYSGSKGAVHNQFQITFKNNETAGNVKSPASFGTIDGWTALGWTASTAASKAVGDAAIKGGTTITVAPAKNEYVYYAVYTQSQTLKYESNANGDTSVKNIPANGTLAGAYYNSSDAKLNITRTIPSTVPTRNGYTFKSWNTQANGSGTNYAAGARYTNSAQIDTLYAQWTENQYTITYVNGNGNADSKVGYKITAEITIIAAPTYDGYVFVGWKVTTVTNGNWTSGDLYGAGAKIGSGKYGNVTLVAQWVYVKDAETKADEYNQDNTISIVTGVDGNGNTTSITTTKYDAESFKKYQDAINAYNNAKKSIPTDINASNYSAKLSTATKNLQDAINALVNITLTERGVVTDYLNNFLIDSSGTRHNLNEMNLNHYDLATTVETAKNALVNGNAIKAKSYGITEKDTDGKTFQTKINEYVAAMAKAFKTKTQVKTEGPGFKVYENADAAKAVTDANGKTLAGATAVNYAYAGKGNYTYYCYTNSTNPTVLITVDDIANAGRVCYPTTAKATAAPTLSGSAKNANAAYTITKIPAGNADNDYLTYTKLSIGGASSYYQQKQVITLTPEFTSGTNGTVTYEFTATDDALTPNVATQSALSSGIGDANSWQKNLTDDTTNTKKITIVVDYHSGDQMTVTGDQVNRDTYLNQYHLFRQSGGASNWELPKTGDKVYKVNDTTYGQTDRGSFTFTYELGATDIGNGKINTTDVNEIIKLFKDESNYSAAKKLSFVGAKYWTKESNGIRVQHEGSGLGYQVWGNNWSFNYYPKSESYTYVHLVDRWGNVVDKVFYVGKQDINEVSVSTASADGAYTILEDGGSGIDTLSLNAGTLEILTDENSTLENNVYRTTGNTVRIKTGEANKSYTLSMKDKATNASTATLKSDGNGIITLSVEDTAYKSGVYTFMLNGTEINLYDGVNNDKYIVNVYDGEAEEGEAAEMIVITTGEVGKTRFTDTDGNTITVAASETNEDGTKTWRMSKSRPAGEYEYRISVKVGHNWIEENSTGKLIFTEKQLDTGRIVKAEYDEESGLYKLTIEGRATKIQFITEDGMTRTYTRYSEAVKSRKSYDAEGNEVPDTGRLLDHEVWLVNARLYSGQNYTVAGKFEAGWNREGTATLTGR